MEYLIDYASPETRSVGEKCIQESLKRMTPERRRTAKILIEQVKAGSRDVFV